jgi:hypothetical protein
MVMIESILKFLSAYVEKLPRIGVPRDKQGHFIVGAVLFFLLAACGAPTLFAVGIVSLIGAAKEIYDHFHPDLYTCDFFDWLATTLGGLFALAVWSVL